MHSTLIPAYSYCTVDLSVCLSLTTNTVVRDRPNLYMYTKPDISCCLLLYLLAMQISCICDQDVEEKSSLERYMIVDPLYFTSIKGI